MERAAVARAAAQDEVRAVPDGGVGGDHPAEQRLVGEVARQDVSGQQDGNPDTEHSEQDLARPGVAAVDVRQRGADHTEDAERRGLDRTAPAGQEGRHACRRSPESAADGVCTEICHQRRRFPEEWPARQSSRISVSSPKSSSR